MLERTRMSPESDRLTDAELPLPAERDEPINVAARLRSAIARFDQGQGVTDSERDAACDRVKTAASKYRVHVPVNDWRDLLSRAAPEGQDRG
jgi:hypothetical protein